MHLLLGLPLGYQSSMVAQSGNPRHCRGKDLRQEDCEFETFCYLKIENQRTEAVAQGDGRHTASVKSQTQSSMPENVTDQNPANN